MFNTANFDKIVFDGIANETYIMTASTGEFALTGIDTAFIVERSIIAEVGSFALTGIDAVLNRGYNFVVSAGSFILTGFPVTFTGVGSWKVTNQSKSTAITPTNQSQNNISPTGQAKSATVTFTNQEKS